MPPVEMKSLVLDIVERVTIAANRIDIWLNRAKIAAALEAGGGSQRPDIDPITLSIEAKVRRAGKDKRLVIENGAEAKVNAGLVELIKEAFAIRNQFLSGSHDSIEAMSGRLGMNKGRLTSLGRLSYHGRRAGAKHRRSAGQARNGVAPMVVRHQDIPCDARRGRRLGRGDEAFARRSMEGFGAFILGRNMFGPVRGEWPDDSWKGWWGDNPPYHGPVFVLTHHARASVEIGRRHDFSFRHEW